MPISARNVLAGVVTAFEVGPVTAEVHISVFGGEDLTATITTQSVRALGLGVGTNVAGIIKASDVLLTSGDRGRDSKHKVSARNCFRGIVHRFEQGPVGAEIAIAVAGQLLIATMTREEAASLAVKVGDHISALIKASSIVLEVISPV